MKFSEVIQNLNTFDWQKQITQSTPADVERVLAKSSLDYVDFLRLLSDAARPFAEQISLKAKHLARQYFGNTIHLYVPMYLSNECDNVCVYCGFNHNKKIERRTLSFSEIEKELYVLKDYGFQHILLLTGESPSWAGADYVNQAIRTARKFFPYVSLEIFAASQQEYHGFVESGASGLTLYQETYHQPTYARLHQSGPKTDYGWRLDAPDRALAAGFRKVGLGALLGLYDWQYEAACLAAHIAWLQKKYWRAEFSLSFPRLRDVCGALAVHAVEDEDLIRLIGAFRLFMPWVDLVLSTREPAELRDRLIDRGITQISAQSSTRPGGYTEGDAGEQFSVADHRSLEAIKQMLTARGLDPVLKDWANEL